MKSSWYSHLHDEEDRKNFKQRVIDARPVLQRLSELLERDIKSLEEEQLSDDFLKHNNLEIRFIHMLARKKELKSVISLINV